MPPLLFLSNGGSGPEPDEYALSQRSNRTCWIYLFEITHYDSLDNLDGDPRANVTDVAYSDLYDGFPSQFKGAVCYGAGTKLRTIQGEITIEDLSVGDLLWTSDAGYQAIVWIGKRTIPAAELVHKPH